MTIRPLREGEVMGAYMDFDRAADRAWSNAEYLTRFGVYISERTAQANAGCAQVREAAQYVLDEFRKTQAAGYRTRDREFAISVLAKALE